MQLGTLLINNILLPYLNSPASLRLPAYLPMQIALVTAATLCITAIISDLKKDTLNKKTHSGSMVMSILTIVITIAWGSLRFVVMLIKTIVIKKLESDIFLQTATLADLGTAQACFNILVGLGDFIFAVLILILFTIAILKSKNRAFAIRTEFSKLSTTIIIVVSAFFNVSRFISNLLIAPMGIGALVQAQTIISFITLIVLTFAILTLAIISLLLGLILKKKIL